MTQTSIVLLCEGYDDRAFFAGFLKSRGVKECRADPWGSKVTGGNYGYTTPSQRFLLVQPCGGRDPIKRALNVHLQARKTRPIEALVVCVDRDDFADGTSPDPSQLTDQTIEQLLHDHEFSRELNPPCWMLKEGTRVELLTWWAEGARCGGVPNKQTLERLVCACLQDVYKDRAAAVEKWLATRPDPPADSPKAQAWSYMAGWYAELGCQAFFERMWTIPQVRARLEERLTATRQWEIMLRLAE